MKTLFQNMIGCDLMTWETNPRMRKKNRTITFYVPTSQEISKGDVIIGTYDAEKISVWEIEEIEGRRKGNMKGRDYVTAKAKWYNGIKSLDFSNYNIDRTSVGFRKLYNLEEWGVPAEL